MSELSVTTIQPPPLHTVSRTVLGWLSLGTDSLFQSISSVLFFGVGIWNLAFEFGIS